MGALGRREPTDWRHVDRFPFAAVAPATVANAEKVLRLPWWHKSHDQGSEGSCVGHGTAMERAITNTAQNRLTHLVLPTRRYNSIWIWNQAKSIDEWPDTNPGDENGTSVRAAYDVLRTLGAPRVKKMAMVNGVPTPFGESTVDLSEGIAANRWATTVDEIRTAISSGVPVAIGVDWYSNFDNPTRNGREWWIGDTGMLGSIRGGHCVCLYGVSDKRQAFKMKNSWGRDYPEVWLPYIVMQKLLNDNGEAAIVTDR